MKKIILLIILSIISYTTLLAQDETSMPIFIPEGMPTFPGGDKAMMKFISDSLRWPSQDICVQGKIYTKFIVRKDGALDSIQIVRGIHPLFDAEAIRVVEAMPKWIPLKNNPQDVWFNLPISFILKDNGGTNARFPDGEQAMMRFINANLRAPVFSCSDCDHLFGRVTLKFTILVDGTLDNIQVIKGIHESRNKAAIQMVKAMPKWIPATVNGKVIPQEFYLPVVFRKY